MFKHGHFSILNFQKLCYRLKIKAFHINLMAVLFIYLSDKDRSWNLDLMPDYLRFGVSWNGLSIFSMK